MDFNKAALEMHETHHGKVGIVSKVEVKNRDQLATAYTPGVAEPCRKIKDVYKRQGQGRPSRWAYCPSRSLSWRRLHPQGRWPYRGGSGR